MTVLDDRITAAAPTVNLASHFDGGCPCDSGAHEAHDLVVHFKLVAGATVRVLGARLGEVTRIELVVEGWCAVWKRVSL